MHLVPQTFPEAFESSIAYSFLKHQSGKAIFRHAAACPLIYVYTMSTLVLLEVTQLQELEVSLAFLCGLVDVG